LKGLESLEGNMEFDPDADVMEAYPRVAMAIVMVVGLLAYVGTTLAFGNDLVLVEAAVFALAFGVVYALASVLGQRLDLGGALS
jgi:hypothetical protein